MGKPPRRFAWLPPRYPFIRGAVLTLLVSAGWLVLYVVNETSRVTATGLLLAMLVGAPVAVWQYRAFAERRSKGSRADWFDH